MKETAVRVLIVLCIAIGSAVSVAGSARGCTKDHRRSVAFPSPAGALVRVLGGAEDH